MKLLLVRHGETVDNIKQLLAGVTDSALTNHGVNQTQRLGRSLASRGLIFTHIYSSDLSRARITADAIRDFQPSPSAAKRLQFEALREQDFGSYECLHWEVSQPTKMANGKPFPAMDDPEFRPQESLESMARRTGGFLDEHIVPLIYNSPEEGDGGHIVAVVAHGIILRCIWREMMRRFAPGSVQIAPRVVELARVRSLESLPNWSNTGYMELDILRIESRGNDASAAEFVSEKSEGILHERSVLVHAVNNVDHLAGLTRTKGGIGSAGHDTRQKTLEGFVTK